MTKIEAHDLRPLLSVFDMPTSVRFYCDTLGFAIESRSPTDATEHGVELFHWCELSWGDVRIMLNTAYDEGERPSRRPAAADDPFGIWLYLGCSDIDAVYDRLQTAGIECKPPARVSYGGKYAFRAISFRDPDGHGITLQWPEDSSPAH